MGVWGDMADHGGPVGSGSRCCARVERAKGLAHFFPAIRIESRWREWMTVGTPTTLDERDVTVASPRCVQRGTVPGMTSR